MKQPLMYGLLLASLMLVPSVVPAQTAGSQAPAKFEKQVVKTLKADYLLYLPKDYGKEADKKWPVLFFLHGSGESGADVEKVKAHGPPKLIAAGKEFPFIVVSPQSPGGGWNVEVLNGLFDEIISKYKVDEDRVDPTGLSMGGYGTWAWALDLPRRFAAIAPICGGGTPRRARALRNLPVWVFHGRKTRPYPSKRRRIWWTRFRRRGPPRSSSRSIPKPVTPPGRKPTTTRNCTIGFSNTPARSRTG